jgi:transcriptional regulator with XRE-family HTH domain
MTEQGIPDIGAALRLARERSGVSLRQIADTTKLSVRSLEALEQNRIAVLPAGIYRRAIVRAYASEVGLDPEAILRSFLAQYPDDVPTAAQPHRVAAAAPKRGALRVVFGLLGAMVPIAAAVLYFTDVAGTRRTQPTGIADVTPLGQPAAIPASRSSAVVDAMFVDKGASPVMMTISVSSRTSLQITAGGREVLSRTLDAGETVHVELSTDVVLAGDNAGAVHFSINGRAGRSLGPANTPLNARILRADYQDWLFEVH